MPVNDNILLFQLESVPLPNEAVTRGGSSAESLQLSVPLQHPDWVQWVRPLLPISKEKNVALDRLGAEVFALCDGRRTVEEIIDIHKDRWHLSFFESRAMILQFLQSLMRYNFIVIAPPQTGIRL